MSMFSEVLDSVKDKTSIKILDIGGGSGNFAFKLSEYYSPQTVEVYLMDNVSYDTWDEFSGKVNFIVESAFEIDKLFDSCSFDIVFMNTVLHHMVFDTWKQTINGFDVILKKVGKILKKDGYLCVSEETAESYIKDGAASFIMYKLTTCKNPVIARVCRKLGAKAAGVGICFLSDSLWREKFDEAGFKLEKGTSGEKRKIKLLWRIFLLLKDYHFFVGYILKKKQII